MTKDQKEAMMARVRKILWDIMSRKNLAIKIAGQGYGRGI